LGRFLGRFRDGWVLGCGQVIRTDAIRPNSIAPKEVNL
jgi:hypothetical protein